VKVQKYGADRLFVSLTHHPARMKLLTDLNIIIKFSTGGH